MHDENPTTQSLEIEVQGTDTIAALERAQVDMQIATAKRYPRTLSKVKADMLSLATLDEETAAGTFFTLPARKGGDGKPIQGPSVRMAEIALSAWGNLKAGARVIADDGKSIVAQAVVIDLEKNVSVSIEVRRRVTTKEGRRYSEDMVNTTANAACSIALRNATFRVVPAALIRPIYEQAKRVAVGDVKSLTSKRADVIGRLKKMGASEAAIFGAVGATKLEDIDSEKLAELIGFGTAIKEGSATLEEVFVDPTKQESTKPVFKESPKLAQPQQQPVEATKPTPEPTAPATPEPTNPAGTPAGTPQDILANACVSAGISFDQFAEWAVKESFLREGFGSFAELPAGVCVRLNKAAKGMIDAIKGGAL